MLWLAATLRAGNFRLTPATVATYGPLCKMQRVEAVLLHRRACSKKMHHVVADVSLVDGAHMRCDGYGATPRRADDDAVARAVVRLLSQDDGDASVSDR